MGELVLQSGLLPGGVEAGAPELIGDEQEDQHAEGDENPSDGTNDSSHGRSAYGVSTRPTGHSLQEPDIGSGWL